MPQYDFVAFVEVTSHSAYQGIRVYRVSDGVMVKELKYEVRGGDDGDVYRQIPVNHRKMMTCIVGMIWDAQGP